VAAPQLPPNYVPPSVTEEDEEEYNALLSDEADTGDDNLVELEDGSVLVKDEQDDDADNHEDFYSNLAEDAKLSPGFLENLASEIIRKQTEDKTAREKRDKQYEEGIRRTGLGNDAPGGAGFEGASRAVHPAMAEACVDFESSAIRELFPPNGPVRAKNFNTAVNRDPARIDRAARKTEHMNWQLTEEITEYRGELEQLLTQLPLGGSQYLKMYWDNRAKRPKAEFVPIDDVFIPFACTNFYAASRMVHRITMDQHDFETAVRDGLYLDPGVAPSLQPEQSASAKATDKVEGKQDTGLNEDGVRELFETYYYVDIPEDTYADPDLGPAPYIITVDVSTHQVISIYRNWAEEDKKQLKLDYIIEWQFIPWRGAYAVGLPHLIGGLSAALTGALRALLDSAHINNMPAMLKLKGARVGGQSTTIEATQVSEIEGPPGVDDIRKVAMPIPYNPPSAVLFQLLGWLDGAAKGVVATAEEKVADAGANTPVGTTLALIEQGSRVYSAIHARLHAAQKKTLEVLHRLNAMYLDDEVQFKDEENAPVIRREDYLAPMDVVPVSDPNIFSETQRFAQLNEVYKLHQMFPQEFQPRNLVKRSLSLMKVPNYEELLTPEPSPKEQNPVNENIAMALGQHANAFPEQNHLAHLQVHVDFLKSPLLGANPMIANVFLPAAFEHIKQHIVFTYLNLMYEVTTAAAGEPLEKLMSEDGRVRKVFDELLATTSPKVTDGMAQELQQGLTAVFQAFDTFVKNQPPPPLDPSAAHVQATKMVVDSKAARDQGELQLKSQQQQLDAQQQQLEMQLEQQDLQTREQQTAADNQLRTLDMQNKDKMNQDDNTTQLIIHGMKDKRDGERAADQRTQADGDGRREERAFLERQRQQGNQQDQGRDE